MKALTVQQPYAHLIALPDDHPEAKRIENRTWYTSYRGRIAIHAGKGRDYLKDGDEELWPEMAFGAIVAVASLVHCFRFLGGVVLPDWTETRFPWVVSHKHMEGPFCWVLQEVRGLSTPVACRGAQGLWEVPIDITKSLI